MNEFAPSNKLVLASIAILIVGMILTVFGFSIDLPALGITGSSIVGASMVLVYRLFKAKINRDFAKKLTVDQKDERLLKIYVHSGNMAFWIGLFAIIILSIFTATKNPIILLFPTILLSVYLGCALYYLKKF